eukprot:XP_016659126.1 PREDICTED: uncharacterized protein LOC107883500 [Acyrthosiphon pisum]
MIGVTDKNLLKNKQLRVDIEVDTCDECDPHKGLLTYLVGDTQFGTARLQCFSVDSGVRPDDPSKPNTILTNGSTRSIYHKLKYHNKWIYIINTLDDVAVTCDHWDNAKNIQLRGVGIITLSEQCRAHTQVVLTPSRHLKSIQYIDFIPPVNIPVSVKIPLLPSAKLESLLTHQNPVVKLNDISDFSKTIEELENAVQEEKDRNILKSSSGMHTKIIIILSIILGLIIAYKLFKIYTNRRYHSHRIIVPRVEVTQL